MANPATSSQITSTVGSSIGRTRSLRAAPIDLLCRPLESLLLLLNPAKKKKEPASSPPLSSSLSFPLSPGAGTATAAAALLLLLSLLATPHPLASLLQASPRPLRLLSPFSVSPTLPCDGAPAGVAALRRGGPPAVALLPPTHPMCPRTRRLLRGGGAPAALAAPGAKARSRCLPPLTRCAPGTAAQRPAAPVAAAAGRPPLPLRGLLHVVRTPPLFVDPSAPWFALSLSLPLLTLCSESACAVACHCDLEAI